MAPIRLTGAATLALRCGATIALLLGPAAEAFAQYDWRRSPNGPPGYGQSERRGDGGPGYDQPRPRDDWRRGEGRERQQRDDGRRPGDDARPDRPRRPPPPRPYDAGPHGPGTHGPGPYGPRPYGPPPYAYPYPNAPYPGWRPAYPPPPPPVYDGDIEDIDAPPPRRPRARPQPERATAPAKPPRRPPPPAAPAHATAPQRADSGVPPAGETRMAPSEVVVTIASNASGLSQSLARRERLQLVKAQPLALTGVTMARYRIPDRRSVRDVILQLERDQQVLSAQPNYLYSLHAGKDGATSAPAQTAQESAQPGAAPRPSAGGALAASQYGLERLRAGVAHVSVRGDGVLTAVIDSGVDDGHRELKGAVARSLDVAATAATVSGKKAAAGPKADDHGTAIAGVIAARDQMRGVAPAARILALRAFENDAGDRRSGAMGSTFAVMLALDEAVRANARVINMSFAGPRDPLLGKALAAAAQKGVVLVAAAGNDGPDAPPAFPAADPHVIAVAATDADDQRLKNSARGAHIAVAAPGGDIIGPRPGDAYQFASGSSLAAAHVSGVAALLLEANPKLTPTEVRKILVETAKDLGPSGPDPDHGAGLVDAAKAVAEAKKLAAAGKAPQGPDAVKGQITEVKPEPAQR